MAKVIAPSHDADKATDLSPMQSLRHHIAISFRERQFGIDSLMTQFSLCKEFRESQISVGACYEVSMMMIQQVVLDSFCHTSQYADNQSPSALVVSFLPEYH